MSQSHRDQYFAEADAREYAGVAVDARVAFIRKTYGHLLGAVLLWVALVATILNVPALRGMVVALWMTSPFIILGMYLVGAFAAQALAHSRSSQSLQYAGLGLYTLLQAVISAPLLLYASLLPQGAGIIQQAGILTLLIFGGLTVIVMLTRKDFSFLRNVLWLAALVAFGLIIASWLGDFTLGTWFVVGMIVLMSGFILYDTSNVLHHYDDSQSVAAALYLFASLVTLFKYILHLAMILNDN